MPSTYTDNLGLEKPASGEKTGTWGGTVNTVFAMLDSAISGIHSEVLASAGTSVSPNTIAITDGAEANALNKQWVVTDGGDLGATAYLQLIPNDVKRICYVRNSLSGSRSLVLFQGIYNASNAVTLTSGEDAIVAFDGTGSSAVVKRALDNAYFTSINVGTFSIDGVEVTATPAQLNTLTGLTATASELNILDGATVTTAELNKLDGATVTTAELNKLDGFTGTVADLNYAKDLRATGVTASEFDKLDGVTSSIQAQLDEKSPISNPSFVGNVTILGSLLRVGAPIPDGSTSEVNSITCNPGNTSWQLCQDRSIFMNSWRMWGVAPGDTAFYLNFRHNDNAVGSITSTASATNYNTSSDGRLKADIKASPKASSKIKSLNIREFDWKKDGRHQEFGLIAQEAREVLPEAVSEDPDGYLGIDYSKFVPMLIKEIQDLRDEVEELKKL